MIIVAGALALAVVTQGPTQSDSIARPRITPLPIVNYNDETGWQFGATVIRSHRTSSDSATRSSSLSAYTTWTTKDYLKWYVQSDIWTPGNSRRWRTRIEYKSYPLEFFGIGTESSESAQEWYSSGVLTGHVFTQRALRPTRFLHVGGRYVRSELHEWEEGGLLASGNIPGAVGRAVSVTTAELGLVVDTRDDLIAPRSGAYARIIPSVASTVFGSDFVFRRLPVDARRYRALGSFATAAQFQYDGVDRTVPFDQLPMIGADSAMRGYPRGRFRDHHAVTTQVEIRSPHWRRRLGAVAFGGIGTVSHSLSSLQNETWFPTAGAGLRFVVLPKNRTIVRLDFAVGRGSTGFSAGIGEAF